ncbi:MAG: hypothetical protein Q8L54_08680 [Devosia sp.]|nr:hypothetical protein [Devosia sp.]
MRIEKRTMNWLPQKSLYQANEAARAKRKAYAKYDISLAASLASAFTSAQTATASDQVTLTIKMAAQRVQASADAKLTSTMDTLSTSKLA